MTFAQMLAARLGTLQDEPWSVDRDAEETYLEALAAAHDAEVDLAFKAGEEAGYAAARADYCYSYTS